MNKKKVSELAKQVRGVSYIPEDLHAIHDNNSVILLRANNINDGRINFEDVVYVDKSKVSKEQYLRKGDILICASSGSKLLVGKAASVDFDIECTFGAFCKVVRPNSNITDYLGTYFQSNTYRQKISEVAIGANINNIRNEHIDSLVLPVGTDEENAEVVRIISSVQKAIDGRKQELQKLDELIKARFVEMFVGKDYTEKTVHDVLNAGFWLMPATPKYVENGSVPYITSKNIKNRQIDFDNVKYITEEAFESISANRPTSVGDILISMIGTLGQTAVISDNRKFYGQNLYLLRLNNQIINTDYFCEFFNSDEVQHILQGKCNQSTQAYLKANHVEDLVLPLPPMEEQDKFAAFVQQVDKSKFVVQQALDKAQMLFDNLMQQYFV